jgi:hypothetical protein
MSSNLRRAISALSTAVQDRSDKRGKAEFFLILPELQEVPFNPDALSIRPAKAPLATSWMDYECVKDIYGTQCDTSEKKGNNPLNSNSLQPTESFCWKLFEDIEASSVLETGHSFWFRARVET